MLDPLRTGYEWASARLHRFILDGMRDHRARFQGLPGVIYYPYAERRDGDGDGLLAELARHAALIVTDDWPSFFIPAMIQSAAETIPTRLVKVDSNGLMPLRATERVYTTAYSFRRGIHKILPSHLSQGFPLPEPLDAIALKPAGDQVGAIIEAIQERWPRAEDELLEDRSAERLEGFEIDHSVPIVARVGGFKAASERLKVFLEGRLASYPSDRNKPGWDGASALSPYLHFGHISPHEVFFAVAEQERWDPSEVEDKKATGKREGWWGMSEPAEAYLDELITWREIGHNMAHHAPHLYMSYESIPDFAKRTLDDHREDEREHLYSYEEFERAETHDPIWNAAQRELLETGEMHNYMRMIWGKKIVEWTSEPEQAAEIMIELNNKWAIDGRDPNSYSGIFWCLGRYDRGWAEREVFGKVRYMSSESTKRKFNLDRYLERFGGELL